MNYFKALDQLQIAILSCYIQKDYQEKKYDFEQTIHKARLNIMGTMKKLRLKIGAQGQTDFLSKLENLYEIVFSLNILKYRVTDYATFEICKKEFAKISVKLSEALKQINLLLKHISNLSSHTMMEETAKTMGKLSNQIDLLEELYRSTLQVVSKDPIFFLFFIQDLMALRDQLESFILGLINDRTFKK